MHSHRILISAPFVDMSSIPVLFQRNIFTFTCFLSFLYTVRYIFLSVALVLVIVVAVAVVEAAVGSVELQGERDSLSAV